MVSEKIDKKQVQVKDSKNNNLDEPSWYHYLIVLLFLGLLIYLFNFFINYYDSNLNPKIDYLNNNSQFRYADLPIYSYVYEENGKKYNFKFNEPISFLKSNNISNEVSKYDLLNSKSINFIFSNYSINDNQFVSASSVKLVRFMKYYLNFKFNKNNFKQKGNLTCKNSTVENKFIFFNPYSNKSGIFYNQSSGCVLIEGKNVTDLVAVSDNLMYDLINT